VNDPIGLIYLGRRGGGGRLAHDMHNSFEDRGIEVLSVLSSESEYAEWYRPSSNICFLNLPSRLGLLLSPRVKKRSIVRIYKYLLSQNCGRVIFVMAHPWNIGLSKFLKKKGIYRISIIHDYAAHDGELWPSRIHILRLVRNTDSLIFLSKYVREKCALFGKPYSTWDLTAHPLPGLKESGGLMDCGLIIGRFKKYKGFEEMNHLKSLNLKLVLAGAGKTGKMNLDSLNITVKNQWLSISEFDEMVMQASCVILPYKSATQSGVISIAKAYNKKIFISPVGGLPEQIVDYSDGHLLIPHKKDYSKCFESSQLNAAPCECRKFFESKWAPLPSLLGVQNSQLLGG
jgi:hypothetical protein